MPEPEVTPPEGVEVPSGTGDLDGTLYEGLATEQPPEAPEGTAPPATVTVVIDGVESEVPLEEAIKGYQRQADYTQKTQTLAEQRAELEQADRLYKALVENPERTLAALSAAYGVGAPETGLEDEDPPDPIQQRLDQLDQFVASQQERELAQQIEGTISALHAQHGEFDDQALMAFAVEHNIPDLKVAHAAMAYMSTEAEKLRADAAVAAAKGGLPPVASGHGVQAGTVVEGADTPIESPEDAWNVACRAAGREDLMVA